MSGLSVAVVAGGPSSEANVSRSSAAGVVAALGEAGHRAQSFELDGELSRALAQARPDVVFPTTHGPLGEDGCLQGLLEVLDLPYVGSGVLASALAASKPHAKLVFRSAGLSVAEELCVHRGDDLAASAQRARERLGDAVVVKPASSGSAIGVTRVAKDAPLADLEGALETALALDPIALVERFAPGAEVTCGVLEDASGVARALPPTLIRSKAADWYDFASRYRAGGSEHVCPAPLADGITERVQHMAVVAHRVLGARDLSRVDFVVGDGSGETAVTLLELNTLPGMTATSLYPEAAAVSGLTFAELCDRLVRRALARPRREPPSALAMP